MHFCIFLYQIDLMQTNCYNDTQWLKVGWGQYGSSNVDIFFLLQWMQIWRAIWVPLRGFTPGLVPQTDSWPILSPTGKYWQPRLVWNMHCNMNYCPLYWLFHLVKHKQEQSCGMLHTMCQNLLGLIWVEKMGITLHSRGTCSTCFFFCIQHSCNLAKSIHVEL